MTSTDFRGQLLATCLAALAGYVDACGFIASGGFFVSFMSGNSTRMGVGAAQQSAAGLVAAGLIASFLLGVISGAMLGQAMGARRRSAVLGLVAALLGLAAALSAPAWGPLSLVALAAAMGAENNVFERKGEVSIGVTYMTGTLVKLGQRVATSLMGGPAFGWLPIFFLWASFVLGVCCGALIYPHAAEASLWVAAAVAGALALVVRPVVVPASA